MTPRRPGTRAGRAGLVYRGPRTSRCGPPRRRLRRLCPPWRSGRRPGRRPTRRRSRRKVTAACPLGSAGPRTSVVRERPAGSRRRRARLPRSARRGASCRAQSTARWARRASGGGAAAAWGSTLAPRAGRRATLTSGPFTWVVSRTGDLDARRVTQSNIAGRLRPQGRQTQSLRPQSRPRTSTGSRARKRLRSQRRALMPICLARRRDGAGPA